MAEEFSIDGLSIHHTISNKATSGFALHCHTTFEVYYFLNGRVSYLVEGKRYEPSPHSILLLAPGTFHGVKIETDEDYERYALHFGGNLLSKDRAQILLSPFTGKEGRGEIYLERVDSYSIAHYFASLLECGDLGEGLREYLIPIRLEALLSQILRMEHPDGSNEAQGQGETVERIVAYLNRNLADPITLDSLSEQFFLSKNHLNHLFKQATGTTVRNYLIHKRVAAAHSLIRQGCSPAVSARQVGFRDYSAFFKAYKKIIGAAPADAMPKERI